MENNASELKSDIKNNMTSLKSDLKSDIKENKASHDNLASCVGTFDACIKKLDQLMHSVPNLVQTVSAKLTENSTNLKEMG